MGLHVIVLSGMNADDTTTYLNKNGVENIQILPNQINRCNFVIGKRKPIRVTLWIALNTKIAQTMYNFIQYRVQNVIFLYDFNKPITLIRALGWWKATMNQDKDIKMVLCSTIVDEANVCRAYDKVISGISNKFLQFDNNAVPHYSTELKKIFKNFLN